MITLMKHNDNTNNNKHDEHNNNSKHSENATMTMILITMITLMMIDDIGTFFLFYK